MYVQANLYYWIYLLLRLLFIMFSICYFAKKIYNKGDSKGLAIIQFIVLTTMCMVVVGGDYWTYRTWYENDTIGIEFEPIWSIIKSFIPNNFDVFRVVVWGSGLLVFLLMCKYAEVNISLAYSLFAVFYFHFYGYARSAVAVMFLLFAFVFLYKKEGLKKVGRYTFFGFFLIIGLSMHRSLIMIIPALAFAPYVKFQRNNIIVLFLLFPFFSVAVNLIFPYISGTLFGDEYIGGKANGYLSNKEITVTYIQAIIQRLPIIILYVVATIAITKHSNRNILIDRISMAVFLVLYTSMLFVTITSGNTTVFFYRILNMAMPFMVMIVSYTMINVKDIRLWVLGLSIYILLQLIGDIRLFDSNPYFIINQINERYII